MSKTKWGDLAGVMAGVRRTGHTNAAAWVAKECGGVVLCANAEQARAVAREHGCETASIHSPEQLRGRNQAFVFDNLTVMRMAFDAMALEDEVIDLHGQLALAQAKRAEIETKMLRLEEARPGPSLGEAGGGVMRKIDMDEVIERVEALGVSQESTAAEVNVLRQDLRNIRDSVRSLTDSLSVLADSVDGLVMKVLK